ncbi:unnamed protein product [Adineta steineri]|uniref:Ammonium transporter n=1 Tax=Adineta steineri TaxID=433720 RepID=A0A819H3W6_9BILA|nr:unnamed protein product [Adineta steineri]CAF3891238.1 unnamed protein product [Adineta steineri]
MSNTTYSDGNTAWVLISTALVYLMTPALACFYGGLVEQKNFLNQLFLSFVCMAIIPVQWCLFGYSFAFGPGNSAFGSFQYALQYKAGLVSLYGEDLNDANPNTVPSLAFIAFQSSFALITPALISGAVVGRVKLIPYMIYIFLWTTFCYDPLARWIFSNQGWLHQMGVIDFAGGLVVHLSSGVSGLVAALILGSRAQFDPDVVNAGQTHLPFTLIGTGLIWIGWMGFNGGSVLAANGFTTLAIVNTNTAAAASMIIWIILDIIHGKLRNKNSVVVSIPGICSAIVVGLVVITPAAGYIQPGYAILMGLIGGFLVHLFLILKKHFFHIDDTLDVFSCHGLGGFIGSILVGLFSQTDVNNTINNGAFYGNPIQLCYQIIGIIITVIYSAVCTAIILLLMHFTIGIRIDRIEQIRGLDNVVHGIINVEQLHAAQQIRRQKTIERTIPPITTIDIH